MDKCVVFYEAWQMQCCGTSFKIGDNVEWPIYKCDVNNLDSDDSLIGVDFVYEAHSTRTDDEMFLLKGVVMDIKADYYKTELQIHNGQHYVSTLVYEK